MSRYRLVGTLVAAIAAVVYVNVRQSNSGESPKAAPRVLVNNPPQAERLHWDQLPSTPAPNVLLAQNAAPASADPFAGSLTPSTPQDDVAKAEEALTVKGIDNTDTDALRERLVKLMELKALEMSNDEMVRTIHQLQDDIDERMAQQALDKAIKQFEDQLQQIVADFPKTKAAKEAAALQKGIPGLRSSRGTAVGNAPFFGTQDHQDSFGTAR